MLPQSHRLDEGFITNLTNMVPLVEMSLCVHPQLVLLHELFWTHRTLEFFHSSVHPLVVGSDGEQSKPFFAVATLIALFTGVQCLVFVQGILILESLTTL